MGNAPSAPAATSPKRPSPCCACKDERRERDDCFFKHGPEAPECASVVEKFRTCMASYGYQVNSPSDGTPEKQ